jgi:glycosyltransferase involved in cell wall biosynthesis
MKPRLLLTTYRKEWLDPGLVEALQERFDVVVKSVRGGAKSQSAGAVVVSKKGLVADEARYLLRLGINRQLYQEQWIFVCYGGHYATLLFARLLRAVGGIRRPVFLLNFYLHELGQNRWIQVILRVLLTEDVRVVAQAAADVDYFRPFLPVENVLYLPYCQGSLELGSYAGTHSDFVFAGGWTNRDYDALFRCAARLPQVEFVVVASAQSAITEPQPANVTLLCDLEPREFHRLMAESYFVVLPLKADVGSSGQMVAVAAMQLGKAVIAPDIGAINDYIANGITGALYQLGNDEGLVRLIEDSYAAPAFVAAMGRAGQQRYMELFTPERLHRPVTEFIWASL